MSNMRGNVVYGRAGYDCSLFKSKTTVVDDASLDDSLLSEEIFGSLFLIVEADRDYKRAAEKINGPAHLPGLYTFSYDQFEIDYSKFIPATGVHNRVKNTAL